MASSKNFGWMSNTNQQRGNGAQSGNQNRAQATPETVAKELPSNYVDAAEQVIRHIQFSKPITNTKLRNLYSLVMDIANVENLRTDETLSTQSITKLMMMRVRIVYEAGREDSVKQFLQEAQLLEYIKGIGDNREKFMCFARYMEALVAYHRYIIGGKEK